MQLPMVPFYPGFGEIFVMQCLCCAVSEIARKGRVVSLLDLSVGVGAYEGYGIKL